LWKGAASPVNANPAMLPGKAWKSSPWRKKTKNNAGSWMGKRKILLDRLI
jgi:epoxyqueuosine reductase QueG